MGVKQRFGTPDAKICNTLWDLCRGVAQWEKVWGVMSSRSLSEGMAIEKYLTPSLGLLVTAGAKNAVFRGARQQ